MRAKTAVLWMSLAQLGRIGSQLGSMLYISKILGPSCYGQMAIVLIFANLSNVLRDLGSSATIIQSKKISHPMLCSLFLMNLAIATGLGLLVASCSTSISSFFDVGDISSFLLLVAIFFPVSASMVVPQALMERAQQFKRLALIESTATVTSFIVAVFMAQRGFGTLSLVLQTISATCVAAALIWKNSSWRPSIIWSGPHLKEVTQFLSGSAGLQINNYLFQNADSFVVGRLIGGSQLGIYSLAYKIMIFPVQNISWVATRTLFPRLSEAARSGDGIEAAALAYMKMLALFSSPVAALLAAASPELTDFMLGNKWVGVGSLLSVMSVTGFLLAINSPAPTLIMGLGKARLLFKISVLGTALHMLGAVIGAFYGARGVAFGYLVATSICVIINYSVAVSISKIRPADIVVSLSWGVVPAGVAYCCARLFKHYFSDHGTVVSVGAASILGGLVYVIVVCAVFYCSEWLKKIWKSL